MRGFIFLSALALCIMSVFFLAALILLALVFNDGLITLDFNHFNEGWLEFFVCVSVGVTGAVGFVSLYKNWENSRNDFMLRNNSRIVVILSSVALMSAVFAVLVVWVYLRG